MNTFKKSFAPLVGEVPTVLILGTLPGERSLAAGEYYAHPANRFWSMIAHVTDEPLPASYDEKTRLLAAHRIALWDVAHSANRAGSADAEIRNEQPNDIAVLLRDYPSIRAIAFNGKGAEKLFLRHFGGAVSGVRFLSLLSTSPANCARNHAEMIASWGQIKELVKSV